MIDLPQIKKVVRLILQHNKKYNLHLKPNELNFLKKFRQENFAPTEKQVSYFYLIIAQIQNKNIQQQLRALKYKIEKLQEFSKNIEL